MSEPLRAAWSAPPAPPAPRVPRALWIALAVLGLLCAGLAGALATRLLAPAPAPVASSTAALPAAGAGLLAPAGAQFQFEPLTSVASGPAPMAPLAARPPLPVGAGLGPGEVTVAQPRPPAAEPPLRAAPRHAPAPVAPRHEPVHAVRPAVPQRVAHAETAAPAPRYRTAAVCASCGVVESVAAVRDEGPASGLGAVTGGVLGAVVGNQMGGGNGRKAMAVLGAIGGGFAGHEVEKRVRSHTVYEVRLRMDDGSRRTVQRTQPPAVGSRLVLDGGAG